MTAFHETIAKWRESVPGSMTARMELMTPDQLLAVQLYAEAMREKRTREPGRNWKGVGA